MHSTTKTTLLRAGLLVAALTLAAGDANAWYCTAKSKSGASGWGFNVFQTKAERTALDECRVNAKGQRCVITSCW